MALKILIVEDNEVSQKLMIALLRPFGNCDTALNGMEGIQAFNKALGEDDRYDLICLDIMMPGMDGHETLKKIRKIEAKNNIKGLERVKIIMTTALSDSENVIGSFKKECEAYIVKPITLKNFMEQLYALELIGQNKSYE